MRIATVAGPGGAVRAGVVEGDSFRPLPDGVTVLGLLQTGALHAVVTDAGAPDAGALGAGVPEPLAGLRLLPPLQPPTVRDFVTFEQHIVAMAGTVPDAWYDAPTFYFTNPHALVGAHDDVAVPPGCQRLDFELEVAAVIGRAGIDLTPDEARHHIVGYTIFNDWSARDLQRREMQVNLGPCKGKDFATTLGPVLVTADELEPHRGTDGFLDLELAVSVNGVEVGRDRLARMSWPFEELVAYASRGAEVRPGDVLGSGTCGNGGCLAELWATAAHPPPPLQPGDVVTMTVEGIGTISNTVVAGRDPVPIPRARRRVEPGTLPEPVNLP